MGIGCTSREIDSDYPPVLGSCFTFTSRIFKRNSCLVVLACVAVQNATQNVLPGVTPDGLVLKLYIWEIHEAIFTLSFLLKFILKPLLNLFHITRALTTKIAPPSLEKQYR